jgi:hypothetical protein
MTTSSKTFRVIGTFLTGLELQEFALSIPGSASVAVAVMPGDRPFDSAETRFTASWGDEDVELDLDPEPWVYGLLGGAKEGFKPARSAQQETGGFVFAPRSGFEQNRELYFNG